MKNTSATRYLAHDRDREHERPVTRAARSMGKRLTRAVVRAPHDRRRVVLIFGCQRSGTTMLLETFLDQSWRILILEEHDRRLVGDDPKEISWEDIPTVFRRIRRLPFEVVAAKPLAESSRAIELMDAAEGVKAIWMLRHYRDVAKSNLKRFGMENAHQDLAPVQSGDLLNWRSKGATDETRHTVIELLELDLTPLDAAALFWWVRNQLYFDQHLWDDKRIRVLRYEQACTCPDDVVRSLSDYIGLSLPRLQIVRKVNPRNDDTDLGDLHPEIERLCENMWNSFAGKPEL